jgi:hypothetical protein
MDHAKKLLIFEVEELWSKGKRSAPPNDMLKALDILQQFCDFNDCEMVSCRRIGPRTKKAAYPLEIELKSKIRRDEIVAIASQKGLYSVITAVPTPSELKNQKIYLSALEHEDNPRKHKKTLAKDCQERLRQKAMDKANDNHIKEEPTQVAMELGMEERLRQKRQRKKQKAMDKANDNHIKEEPNQVAMELGMEKRLERLRQKRQRKKQKAIDKANDNHIKEEPTQVVDRKVLMKVKKEKKGKKKARVVKKEAEAALHAKKDKKIGRAAAKEVAVEQAKNIKADENAKPDYSEK